MDKLKRALDLNHINHSERYFETEKGVESLGENPFVRHTIKINRHAWIQFSKNERFISCNTCIRPEIPSEKKNLRTWVGIEPTTSHLRCDYLLFIIIIIIIITVEPRLADTPEMRTSTIMRTLCMVPNALTYNLVQTKPLKCGHPPIP